MVMLTMERYGYIYKTYIPSKTYGERFYIGRKKSSIVVESYFGSGKFVFDYIEKHGTAGLRRDILAWAYSEEELNALEIHFIAEGKKFPNCTNMHDGGGSWDVINRSGKGGGKAFSAHNLRMKNDPEYRKRILQRLKEANQKKAREMTDEERSRCFCDKDGNKIRTRGTTGFVFSEESRKKMSESHSGSRNGMYGKYWITDGTSNKLWSDSMGNFPAGFERGRKLV